MVRVVMALVLLLAGCGAAPAEQASQIPITPVVFTLAGTLQLRGMAVAEPDHSCVGKGGYSDIGPGVSVTVYDPTGRVVGTGSATEATSKGVGLVWDCVVRFAVPGVPAGFDFYQVEVSHRGRETFTAEQARRGVVFTLG